MVNKTTRLDRLELRTAELAGTVIKSAKNLLIVKAIADTMCEQFPNTDIMYYLEAWKREHHVLEKLKQVVKNAQFEVIKRGSVK